MEEQVVEEGLRKKRRMADEAVRELEKTLRELYETVKELDLAEQVVSQVSQKAVRRSNYINNDINEPLDIMNDSGEPFGQRLSIEEVRAASGPLLALLKAHFGIGANVVHVHKTLLKCINADLSLLLAQNDEIKSSNTNGKALKPLMNGDFQYPSINGALVSLITPDIIQEFGNQLCEHYGREADNPEEELRSFLGSPVTLLDRFQSYYMREKANEERIIHNYRITETTTKFKMPAIVSELPPDFPPHETVDDISDLSVPQLRNLLDACDVVYNPRERRPRLEARFYRECGLLQFLP